MSTEVRNHPHTAKLYLAVKTPRIVWRGEVESDRGTFRDGNLYTDMTIAYTADSEGDQAGFSLADFLPDVTCRVGSDEDPRGKCRVVSHDPESRQLSVRADPSCVWRKGDPLAVTDLHELWPRPQRITITDETATVHKDWTITERAEQPVPIMGPPVCAFVGTAICRQYGI